MENTPNEEDIVVYHAGDFLVARSNPECGFTFLLCKLGEDIRLSELSNRYKNKPVLWLRDGRESMRGIYLADQWGLVQMGAIIGKASLDHTTTENTFFLSEEELSQILSMVQKDGEVEELIEAGRPLTGLAEGVNVEGLGDRKEELSQGGADGGEETPTRKRRRQPFLLPEGWSEMSKVRQDGTSKGRRDVYFVSPDKKVFRSRAAVLKYLKGETSDDGKPEGGKSSSKGKGAATPVGDEESLDGDMNTPKKVRRPYRCTVCGEIKKGHHCKGKPSPLPTGDLPGGLSSPTALVYPPAGYPSLSGSNAQFAVGGMGTMGLSSLELSQLQLFAPLLAQQDPHGGGGVADENPANAGDNHTTNGTEEQA